MATMIITTCSNSFGYNGVSTGVIPHCMPYCKADGPVPTNMLTYGICIGQFEKYRVCFRTYLKHHPSIRGDE
ncbi:unnamed protein product [Strongylus vulgaris]|uniref:Domain of unknown function DB domain-containing protein n=1 Tax=Strongylus vulgaris TaxID=40348 RepID=A0A3P7JX07_STRVU|nr:unnamed protein product [Strongylus vulgaris]